MTKKVRKFANGGALSDIVGTANPYAPGYSAPNPSSIGSGFGGGSAQDGLGQVSQGSQTISSALQRAQQANSTAASAAQQANAAVGGGGTLGGSGGAPDYAKGYAASLGGDTSFSNRAPAGNLIENTNQPVSSGANPMKKGGTVKKYAKGGRISLEHCGVSTHKPAKKNANW